MSRNNTEPVHGKFPAMRTRLWVVLLVVVAVVAVWLILFSQSHPDTSFLVGVPCEAPCWQGITPGVTDESSALEIIYGSEIVQHDTITCDMESNTGPRSWCFFVSLAGGHGAVEFDNKIASLIEIGPSPHLKLDLGQVIEAFGEPTYVYVEEYDKQHDIRLGHNYYYSALFFPDRGIEVWATVLEKRENGYKTETGSSLYHAEVYQEMEVLTLYLAEPRPDLEPLASLPAYSTRQAGRIYDFANDWAGFGFYPLAPDP